MSKLDRLGWAAGVAFTAYGVTAGVRVSDRAALPAVVERLPPGGGGGRRPSRRLSGGGGVAAPTHDVGAVFPLLESHLRLYVAERAPRRVFVHAGVVGWRGPAVLIPGRRLSGKTSL